jgi:plasmid stabilization system protein ParE
LPSLRFTEEGARDLARVAEFLFLEDPSVSGRVFALVLHGLQVLEVHPLIGRPGDVPYRELVISHGRTGYIALYELDAANDQVIIHGIRHQREAGYTD